MEKKKSETGTFAEKDKVIFIDFQGNSQKGVIVGLPKEGSTKYLVQLSHGTYPINPCYLEKE